MTANEPTLKMTMNEIENDINAMNGIDNIKKMVEKYIVIKNKIDSCKSKLNDVTKQINIVVQDDDNSIISDDDYIKYMRVIEEIKQKFSNNVDNLDVEDMINMFVTETKLIQKCCKYLQQQKLEITNVD